MSSRVVPVLLVVLLVGIGVIAFVVNTGGEGEPEGPETPVATGPTSPDATGPDPNPLECATEPVAVPTEPEFTEFAAEDAGITLSYPAGWVPFEPEDDTGLFDPEDETAVFGAISAANPCDVLILRRFQQLFEAELPDDLDRGDLESLAEWIEEQALPASIEKLRDRRLVEVDGLPGWNYLYRFEDRETGQVGVHSHYFLFRDNEMITLVLQALPGEGFESLAPIFDRIQASLEVSGAGREPASTPSPARS